MQDFFKELSESLYSLEIQIIEDLQKQGFSEKEAIKILKEKRRARINFLFYGTESSPFAKDEEKE